MWVCKSTDVHSSLTSLLIFYHLMWIMWIKWIIKDFTGQYETNKLGCQCRVIEWVITNTHYPPTYTTDTIDKYRNECYSLNSDSPHKWHLKRNLLHTLSSPHTAPQIYKKKYCKMQYAVSYCLHKCFCTVHNNFHFCVSTKKKLMLCFFSNAQLQQWLFQPCRWRTWA